MARTKIVLKTHKLVNPPGDVVRIDEKARRILSELMRQYDLSAKYIVSQLIIQGSEFIEMEEE